MSSNKYLYRGKYNFRKYTSAQKRYLKAQLGSHYLFLYISTYLNTLFYCGFFKRTYTKVLRVLLSFFGTSFSMFYFTFFALQIYATVHYINVISGRRSLGYLGYLRSQQGKTRQRKAQFITETYFLS